MTGARGFVGRSLVRCLMEQQAHVSSFVTFHNQIIEEISDWSGPGQNEMIFVDLRSASSVQRAVEGSWHGAPLGCAADFQALWC